MFFHAFNFIRNKNNGKFIYCLILFYLLNQMQYFVDDATWIYGDIISNNAQSIFSFQGNLLVNTMCTLCYNTQYKVDDGEFHEILSFNGDLSSGLGLTVPFKLFPWLRFLPHTPSFKRFLNAVERFVVNISFNLILSLYDFL